MRRTASVYALLFFSTAFLLTGCAASFDPDPTPLPTQTSLKGITGNVHGGRQPIIGAQIYVFAAGSGGYGGNGLAASSANASTSLLTSYSTGSFPTAQNTTGNSTTNPLFDDYYVTTDANGNFALTGEYTCTEGTQVYLYSLGGQPSPGITNNSAGLLALLGQCPASGSMASVTPTVFINEVSTVAAAYAFAGFATDAVHVGSSGTTLAQTGIANAFANASNLYAIGSGGVALATTPGGNGTVPQSTINALANSLAACINSTGAGSSQCTTLFSDARIDGTTTGTEPTDTASAAINIAHYPGQNVSAICGLAAAIGTPYEPTATCSSLNDLTISISFTDGGTEPGMVAIDAAGNAWIANCSTANTLSKLSPRGVAAVGSPFTGNGLPQTCIAGTADSEQGIAIDPSGNVWLNNNASNSLSEFTSSGSAAANSPFTYANSAANVGGPMAIDANGNVWILGGAAYAQGSGLNEISNSGAVLSPAYQNIRYSGQGYYGADGYALGFDVRPAFPGGIAIDKGASNVFVNATYTGGSIYGEVLDFSTSGDTFGTPSTGDNVGQNLAGVAYDSFGSVWLAGAGGLARYTAGTNPSAVYSSEVSTSVPSYSVAIDGAGTVWVGGLGNAGPTYSALSEFASPGATSNSPTLLSPSTGFFANGSGMSNASTYALALDGSGDLWYTGCNTNCGTGQTSQTIEFIGIAAPVITPLSAATSSSSSGPGTRP